MSEIMVRERFLRSGKKVYEYSFEMASVDGKRKRKSKSGFASKRDARIAGRKALSEYENVGQVMVDRDISYADFLDLWMENDCKLTCKESTLYGYEKKIRLYLKPELGGYTRQSGQAMSCVMAATSRRYCVSASSPSNSPIVRA